MCLSSEPSASSQGSMRHECGKIGMGKTCRLASKDQFSPSGVPVATHHQQIGAEFLSACQQGFADIFARLDFFDSAGSTLWVTSTNVVLRPNCRTWLMPVKGCRSGQSTTPSARPPATEKSPPDQGLTVECQERTCISLSTGGARS